MQKIVEFWLLLEETYSYGPPLMAGQKQDDLLEHTFVPYP